MLTLKLCCAAEKLKLPYLSPYLDSVGTNFRHGANFATGGSSIRPGGYSPFHLGIQLSQFIRFKSQSIALYKQQSPDSQFLTLIHSTSSDRISTRHNVRWFHIFCHFDRAV